MNATVRPESADAEPHFTISAFGVRVPVQISGNGASELAAHILEAWARCDPMPLDGPPSADMGVTVRALLDTDAAVVLEAQADDWTAGTTLADVSELLTPSITASALERAAEDLLMLHAAAVADPTTGQTVVLVGPSGAGKSTAARAMCGPDGPFAYVTDETLAVGTDLRPRHFAKPLSLFPTSRDWGKEQLSPNELQLKRAPGHLTLAGVLFLERTLPAGEEPIRLDLPLTETIARLGENSSYLGRLTNPVQRLHAFAKSCGGGALVAYADAADLVPLVQSCMSGHQPLESQSNPFVPALASSSSSVDRWVSNSRQDDVMVDDHMVTFRDGQLSTLSPVGATLLALMNRGPVGLEELAEALVERFGMPEGDPTEITRQALESLRASDLIHQLPAQPSEAP